MCKEYKVTGLGKPVEFLVIVMYAKESIRLMNFKERENENVLSGEFERTPRKSH